MVGRTPVSERPTRARAIQRVGPPRPLPSRALVLGASGMVGRSWCGLLTAHGVPYRAVARPDFDLADPASVADTVRAGDTLVINAAAWTDVDGAEANEPAATTANSDAPVALAKRCAALGAALIHYSTDYVFDGRGVDPYREADPISPVNAYGRSKAGGEAGVLGVAAADSIVIRTSWVYAPWGKNFVRTIAKLAAERESLRVVDDQTGRPTSAEGLAATSLAIYLAGASGLWHACDGGNCTWHGLAAEIVRGLGLSCRVEPCRTAEFPRPAPRPAYGVLDLAETEALIGTLADWRVSLAAVLRRLAIEA